MTKEKLAELMVAAATRGDSDAYHQIQELRDSVAAKQLHPGFAIMLSAATEVRPAGWRDSLAANHAEALCKAFGVDTFQEVVAVDKSGKTSGALVELTRPF